MRHFSSGPKYLAGESVSYLRQMFLTIGLKKMHSTPRVEIDGHQYSDAPIDLYSSLHRGPMMCKFYRN